MTRTAKDELLQVLRTEGSVSRVLAHYPTDEFEAPAPGPWLRGIIRQMESAGSPAADIATATLAFEEHADDRAPVPRLLLIHEGQIILDELLPDVTLHANEASFDLLPSLLPLFEQRQQEFAFVILEASAGGGRIRTFFDGARHADDETTVEGETEHLHQSRTGGFPHSRYEHHTQEVWKRNETELAAAVNDLVERHDVRLLVVTGDPDVVDLVSGALSSRARGVLTTLGSDTIAAGASTDELSVVVATQRHRLDREHQEERIARAAAQQGAEHAETDLRLQPIVHALQQARVETLLLDRDALQAHTLLNLASEPWVASVAAEAFGASIVGSSSSADALARAAIATSAEVLIVDPGALAGGASAAIVRR